MASLKVLFHRVCIVTDSWDDVIDDQEIVKDIMVLFNHIKVKLKSLLPYPRCFKTLGMVYKKIVGMSDGSLYRASYTLHLISGPPGTDLMNFSILVGAGTLVKSHTVPANESSSSLMVVEAAYTFLQDHSVSVLEGISVENPF